MKADNFPLPLSPGERHVALVLNGKFLAVGLEIGRPEDPGDRHIWMPAQTVIMKFELLDRLIEPFDSRDLLRFVIDGAALISAEIIIRENPLENYRVSAHAGVNRFPHKHKCLTALNLVRARWGGIIDL